jgi:hypothetical protein
MGATQNCATPTKAVDLWADLPGGRGDLNVARETVGEGQKAPGQEIVTPAPAGRGRSTTVVEKRLVPTCPGHKSDAPSGNISSQVYRNVV